MAEPRTLTDADVDAIADKLEQRVLERLQVNVGKGVISMVWTWSVRIVILIAAYGAGSSGFIKRLLG